MAEADGKSPMLNGTAWEMENTHFSAFYYMFFLFHLQVFKRKCLCLLGGSDENQSAEDQLKEEDASGSKDGQSQSSPEDGNNTFVALIPHLIIFFNLLYALFFIPSSVIKPNCNYACEKLFLHLFFLQY